MKNPAPDLLDDLDMMAEKPELFTREELAQRMADAAAAIRKRDADLAAVASAIRAVLEEMGAEGERLH